jgi:hypothetical protein
MEASAEMLSALASSTLDSNWTSMFKVTGLLSALSNLMEEVMVCPNIVKAFTAEGENERPLTSLNSTEVALSALPELLAAKARRCVAKLGISVLLGTLSSTVSSLPEAATVPTSVHVAGSQVGPWAQNT